MKTSYNANEGKFSAETHLPDADCIMCETGSIYFRTWDSHDGAYSDTKYRCNSCGTVWWVDGDDG